MRPETELEQLIPIVNRTHKPVLIEAGHIYMDETPGFSHEMGAKIAVSVNQLMCSWGVPVTTMLFVDDLNVDIQSLDLESYKASLKKIGFEVDTTVTETSLLDSAELLIGLLQQAKSTEFNKNGALILKREHKRDSEVVLRRSLEKGGKPSCEVLDVALYIAKATQYEAGVCVTVLEKSWKKQQIGVKKVLSTLGMRIPILNVYYTLDGDIEVDFDF